MAWCWWASTNEAHTINDERCACSGAAVTSEARNETEAYARHTGRSDELGAKEGQRKGVELMIAKIAQCSLLVPRMPVRLLGMVFQVEKVRP